MNEYFIEQEIINCKFLFKCRQSWEKMDNTETDGVRYCGECKRDVYFADTAADLERLSGEGKCVALFTEGRLVAPDHRREVTAGIPAPPEWNIKKETPAPPPISDLPKCAECQTFLPKEAEYCVRCGAARDGSRGDMRKEFSLLDVAVETPEPLEEKSWLQKLLSIFSFKK